MALVTNRELLGKAFEEGYAVGAFNVNNMEFLQAITSAAREEKSPVIIAVSEGAIKYAGFELVVTMTRTLAQDVSVPMSLHLDHGKDISVIKQCIEGGFTSVMIDASDKEFGENVRITKSVVELARPRGVSVEAELGRLAGIEEGISVTERDALLTDPSEAAGFVKQTGVDSLAVSIGTSHGAYKFKGETILAIDRVREIRDSTGIPLVLHGASGVSQETVSKAARFGATLGKPSGVPDESIRQAIGLGIAKVNIDTDMRLAFMASLRETLAEKASEFDPRKILGPAREAVKAVVTGKMRLFGSSGRVA
ncbi:MAG: class II fructose-1,6-bisphosphate aldolase [Candidatus Eiseniibacteriota bacterium]|nr:MAG: class II fructose-1,6-bisphosphate aldolase [Candidatus Eisenbacteria bacterium]